MSILKDILRRYAYTFKQPIIWIMILISLILPCIFYTHKMINYCASILSMITGLPFISVWCEIVYRDYKK